MPDNFIKRTDLDTETHTQRLSREDEGSDQGDASTGPRKPKVASKPAEARGGAWNRRSLTARRSNQRCAHADLGLPARTAARPHFSAVEAPGCSALLQQPKQRNVGDVRGGKHTAPEVAFSPS